MSALSGVFVAGVGMHPFQFPTETPYVALGLRAVHFRHTEMLAEALDAREVVAWAVAGSALTTLFAEIMLEDAMHDDLVAELHPRLAPNCRPSTTATQDRDWRCGPPPTR